MTKLQKNLKSVFSRKDVSGLSLFGHGHHFDWKFLLSAFFLLILGVLLFSTQVFLGVRAGNIFQANDYSVTPITTINRNGLDQAVKDFATRSDRLKNIQNTKTVLVDPSQ